VLWLQRHWLALVGACGSRGALRDAVELNLQPHSTQQPPTQGSASTIPRGVQTTASGPACGEWCKGVPTRMLACSRVLHGCMQLPQVEAAAAHHVDAVPPRGPVAQVRIPSSPLLPHPSLRCYMAIRVGEDWRSILTGGASPARTACVNQVGIRLATGTPRSPPAQLRPGTTLEQPAQHHLTRPSL
jgi:hypothetical protein